MILDEKYLILHYVQYKPDLFSLLFQDPHAEEFEDKEWTFVIENVSNVVCSSGLSIFLPLKFVSCCGQ